MEYKIYGLTEPQGPMKHVYIGFTIQDLCKRLSRHISKGDRSYKCSWIKNLKEQGLSPKIFLIKLTDAKNWAKDEREEIERWRLTQETTGIKVLNMTDGGDGILGYRHTEESKIKIGKASLGNKHSLGFKHTAETKQKVSAASKSRPSGFKGKSHKVENIKVLSEKNRRTSYAMIENVTKMSVDGFSQREIAAELNISRSRVFAIVNKIHLYLK